MRLIHRKRVRWRLKWVSYSTWWRLKLMWGIIRVVLVLLHNTVYYSGLLYHASLFIISCFSSICSCFSQPFLDVSTTSLLFILTLFTKKLWRTKELCASVMYPRLLFSCWPAEGSLATSPLSIVMSCFFVCWLLFAWICGQIENRSIFVCELLNRGPSDVSESSTLWNWRRWKVWKVEGINVQEWCCVQNDVHSPFQRVCREVK